VTAGAAALLATARALPLGVVAPPLGGPARSARLVVAALLAGVAWPALLATPAPQPFALAIARELAVGLALALVVAVPFRAAEAAGALVEDAWTPPAAPRARALLGDAWSLGALALFGALSGPALLVRGWALGYAAFPVGDAPAAAAGVRVAVEAGAQLVTVAATLAAPALAAVLLVELGTGLLVRAQPALEAALGQAAVRRLAALAVVALTAGGALAVLRSTRIGALDEVLAATARALGGR
jgi:flagellar biosynthesis protein FliR